ncbi:MAG: ATP-grasp domain-containing protein [bacterium]
MPTILISSMGSTAAQNLARILTGQTGWRTIGGDMESAHGGLGLCDVDVRLPRGDDSCYAATAKAMMEAHQAQLFVPVMEPELLAMCSFASEAVVVSKFRAVSTARSKKRQNIAFESAGLRPIAEVEARWTGKIMFARPDFGTGSRGALLIRSETELTQHQQSHPDSIYCEYLDGSEFSFDGFVDQTGTLRGLISRRRIEVRNGLAVKSEIVATPSTVIDGIRALVMQEEVRGFFNVQAIQVGQDFFFHDFNPRPGGAMYLSFVGGLPPDLLLTAWMNEGPWPVCEPRVGAKLFRRYENIVLETPS